MVRKFTGSLIADLHTDDGLIVPVVVSQACIYLPQGESDYYLHEISPTGREIRVGDEVIVLDTGEYQLGVVVQKTVGENDMITAMTIREVK